MGRWSFSSKKEADGLKKIETSWLRQQGYFQGMKSGMITWTFRASDTKDSVSVLISTLEGDNYMRLSYTQTDRDSGEKKDFDYCILLTSTPCHYGGRRYWFTCPFSRNGTYCGRRVGVLYKDGDYFACRHCYDLTYNSRKLNRQFLLSPLFNVLYLEGRIEKLKEKTKRRTYAGIPTRKGRRLLALSRQLQAAGVMLQGGKDTPKAPW
jgi:hypothetical protein